MNQFTYYPIDGDSSKNYTFFKKDVQNLNVNDLPDEPGIIMYINDNTNLNIAIWSEEQSVRNGISKCNGQGTIFCYLLETSEDKRNVIKNDILKKHYFEKNYQ